MENVEITVGYNNSACIMISERDEFAIDAAINEFGMTAAQIVNCPQFGKRHDFIATLKTAREFVEYVKD